MFVPRLDYASVLAVLACMTFFGRGARLEGRSPLVWCGLSLAMWIGFTHLLVEGVLGGLMSQILLFAGLTAVALLRERVAAKRRR